MRQAVPDPLRGLADRDTGGAVSHEDDLAQIQPQDLVDDVLDVRPLPGRDAPLLGEAGERQRWSP
ncbi:hypothetical protein GCM10017776_49030 [Streptomyces griseoluteus]|nr:hypothetical protein GCM10017776_49030 [Streptomyces griseoluteus]